MISTPSKPTDAAASSLSGNVPLSATVAIDLRREPRISAKGPVHHITHSPTLEQVARHRTIRPGGARG